MGAEIAFHAQSTGIDNISKIDTSNKKISALSASKYGAFYPSKINGQDSLLFSNYTADGYMISAMPVEPQTPGRNGFVNFGLATQQQENTKNVFLSVPDSSFASKPYKTLSNLFNVHSVIPVIENEYKFGLQLNSNNLLSTVDIFAEADYHRDINRFEYVSGLRLKTFYPILSATYYNRPRRTFYNSSTKGTQQGDWREHSIQLQASVPLSFNVRNHSYNISANVFTSYTSRYMPENLPNNFISRLSFPLHYSTTFTHTTRTAERDMGPRWAQTLRLTYVHQPFDDQLPGRLFAAEGFLYFPGIFRNHSFLTNFNWQTATGIRRFDREINAVYGYNNIRARSTLKNTLLLNYRFPFAFPDAEIGPLAYIRNLRTSFFCHYENIGLETNLAEPKTYGFELRSSLNLLRYQPIVDLGARFVFVNKSYHQNPILELIFNYSF